MLKEEYLNLTACPCCGKTLYNENLFNNLTKLNDEVECCILLGFICKNHSLALGEPEFNPHNLGDAVDIYIGASSCDDKKVIDFVNMAEKYFDKVVYKKYKGLLVHLEVE
jgi:hypothetical protein